MQFRGIFVTCEDQYILLLKQISSTIFYYKMQFLTNGLKRFSWTKSPDPRQRVPLSLKI